MGRLYECYLQNEEEPDSGAVYVPYQRDTCKGCKHCESRRTGKFTSVFYCTERNRYVSPSSVKGCFKIK